MQEIKDFLSKNKTSICREERQYALFLYNIFFHKKKLDKAKRAAEISEFSKNVIEKCLGEKMEDIIIEEVYYEATLMRDYHFYLEKDNKDKFVHNLMKFCFVEKDTDELVTCICDKINGDNPGAKTGSLDDIFLDEKNSVLSNISFSMAKMMMNATPDIMVIYRENSGTELRAKGVECKYLSSEGSYKDVFGSKRKMQFFVQECVMTFLFGNWSKSAKGYVPQRPTKGYWKDNKDQWKDIYEAYYSKILSQTTDGVVGKIINNGISVARFIENNTDNSLKSNDGEVMIDIASLLSEEYFFE